MLDGLEVRKVMPMGRQATRRTKQAQCREVRVNFAGTGTVCGTARTAVWEGAELFRLPTRWYGGSIRARFRQKRVGTGVPPRSWDRRSGAFAVIPAHGL